MSLGSVLVAVAVGLVVAALLARPFRVRGEDVDWERTIEAWVAQVRAEGERGAGATEKALVNHCPQCGRRVGPGDRFCAGCGAQLSGGEG
jgi:hypothetical protein